jgi:hypothetical protein
MLEFFIEGGWGMWPVSVFGLVMLGSAARYAWDIEPTRLRFVIAMGVLLVCTMVHATLTDLAAVFSCVSDPVRAPADEVGRILFIGLKESTRPGVLGGAFLTLSLVMVAVGVYRDGRRELSQV